MPPKYSVVYTIVIKIFEYNLRTFKSTKIVIIGVPSEFGQNSTLSRWQKPQRSWVGPKKVRRIRKLRKISYNFPTDAKLKLSKNPCSA